MIANLILELDRDPSKLYKNLLGQKDVLDEALRHNWQEGDFFWLEDWIPAYGKGDYWWFCGEPRLSDHG